MYRVRAQKEGRRLTLHPPYKGIVQNWETTFRTGDHDEVHYLLFDVHYYLKNWQPRVQGRVHLVGG